MDSESFESDEVEVLQQADKRMETTGDLHTISWVEQQVVDFSDLLRSTGTVHNLDVDTPDNIYDILGSKIKKSATAPIIYLELKRRDLPIFVPFANHRERRHRLVLRLQQWWIQFHEKIPTFSEALVMAWPVVLFAVIDSSKSLIVNWAEPKVNSGTIVTIKNLLSSAVGMGLAFEFGKVHEPGGIRDCLNFRRIWLFLPVAFGFSIAQIFSIMALKYIDAGIQKVTAQLSIPTIAFFSRIVLRRVYSSEQWRAMFMLFLCATPFVELNLRPQFYFRKQSENGDQIFLGLVYVVLSILLSCFSSVIAEYSLKKTRSPYYVLKTNLMFGELIVSTIATLAIPFNLLEPDQISSETLYENLVNNWDWKVSLMMLDWLVHGWIAGLIAKRFSALTKRVSQTFSTFVTFFVSVYFYHRDTFWVTSLLAWLVILSVIQFSVSAPALVELGSRKLDILYPIQRTYDKMRAMKPYHVVSLICVVSFVIMDALKSVMINWCDIASVAKHRSLESFEPESDSTVWWSFLWIQSIVSFCLALLISYLRQGYFPLRTMFDLGLVFRRLPLSACLVVSKLFQVMALSRLDAASVRIATHLGTPVLAIISAIMLRQHFTLLQWISLLQIALSTVAFFELHLSMLASQNPSRNSLGAIELLGASYLLISLTMNSLAGVCGERFLKTRGLPFHVQKGHLLLGQVFITSAIHLLTSSARSRTLSPRVFMEKLFQGWNLKIAVTCLVWVVCGWLATLIVKTQSALVKQIVQSVSAILTFFMTILSRSPNFRNYSRAMTSLIMVVFFSILGTFSFFLATEKVRKRIPT